MAILIITITDETDPTKDFNVNISLLCDPEIPADDIINNPENLTPAQQVALEMFCIINNKSTGEIKSVSINDGQSCSLADNDS